MPNSPATKFPRTADLPRTRQNFDASAIWLANILLIGGAVLISAFPATASSPILFSGFLIGHVFLTLRAIHKCDRGMLILNLAMTVLDLYAVAIRL